MLNPDDDTPIDALEAMYEDAALAAADDPSQITPQDRAAADALRRRMAEPIAARRRSFLPAHVEIKRARPIRPSYLAMGRDQLLAALQEIIKRLGPELQIAHRHLTELTDNDLRLTLETIDAEPEEP
jgi:hypothetical protein